MFLYFILGMLAMQVVIPVLDALTGLIVTAMEVLKGKLNLTIVRINNEMQKLGAELDPPKPCIGFHVDPVEYVDEEEEDV